MKKTALRHAFVLLLHTLPFTAAMNVQAQESRASAESLRIPVHLTKTFAKAYYGKSQSELKALLGPPAREGNGVLIYDATAPGQNTNIEALLFIWFAGNKARSFQVDSGSILDQKFIESTLAESPMAHFAREVGRRDASDQRWTDAHNGFSASCTGSKQLFVFTLDLTPVEEREISPLWRDGHP